MYPSEQPSGQAAAHSSGAYPSDGYQSSSHQAGYRPGQADPTGGYQTDAEATRMFPMVGQAPPGPGTAPGPHSAPPRGPHSAAGRLPRQQPSFGLGEALTAGGALFVFLFSFAPFVCYSADPEVIEQFDDDDLPTWFSAWALETFLAPLSWWVLIAALGMIALVGLRFVAPKDREFMGFRSSQLQLGLSFFAFFVLLGYALSSKTLLFGSDLQQEFDTSIDMNVDVSFGWGGSLMLLGALVAAVGAVLNHVEIGPTVWPRPAKPAGVYGRPSAPPAGQQAWASPHYPQSPGHMPTQAYPQQAHPASAGGAAPGTYHSPQGQHPPQSGSQTLGT